MKEFNITYTFGKGKGFFPDGSKSFSIKQEDIEDMNKDDLEEFYHDAVFDHFRKNIFPTGMNMYDFVFWAKSVLEERNKD